MMKFFAVHIGDLESPEFLDSTDEQIATWLRLHALCSKLLNNGVIEGAKTNTERYWARHGIDAKTLQQDCALWTWKKGDLSIQPYDSEGQKVFLAKQKGGQKGAKSRWSNRNPNRTPNKTPDKTLNDIGNTPDPSLQDINQPNPSHSDPTRQNKAFPDPTTNNSVTVSDYEAGSALDQPRSSDSNAGDVFDFTWAGRTDGVEHNPVNSMSLWLASGKAKGYTHQEVAAAHTAAANQKFCDKKGEPIRDASRFMDSYVRKMRENAKSKILRY